MKKFFNYFSSQSKHPTTTTPTTNTCINNDLYDRNINKVINQYNKFRYQQDWLVMACEHGHMEIVRWFLDPTHKYHVHRGTLFRVTINDEEIDYKIGHVNGTGVVKAYLMACEKDNLDIIKLFEPNFGIPRVLHDGFFVACQKGSFKIIDYIFRKSSFFTESISFLGCWIARCM